MLVNAKCPNCGANIEVDNDKDAGICKFCGSAFVTEKAINNYNITNNISIENSNVTIQNNGHTSENVKISVGRAWKTISRKWPFDIFVDGVEYATVLAGEIVEINIDKNKEHRIQVKYNTGEVHLKSNVLYFEAGEISNMIIEKMSLFSSKLSLSTCSSIEELKEKVKK